MNAGLRIYARVIGCITIILMLMTPYLYAGNLQITEINYKPMINGVEDERLEFIEIYNAGDQLIRLANYRISEGVNFIFPAGAEIKSKSYMLVVKDIDAYPAGVDNKYEWLSGSLKNTGETIKILDDQGEIVTRVVYSSYTPWPVPTKLHNYSIELEPGAEDYTDPDKWHLSYRYGGTPGFRNRSNPLIDLTINEFMAKNDAFIFDESGHFPDWIEIYNASNIPQNIGGVFISNDPAHPDLFQIPYSNNDKTTVMPGGYLVFWADDEPDRGVMHIGLRLMSQGGDILMARLTSGGIEVLDHLKYPKQHADFSYGRYPDGSANLEEFNVPSPNDKNIVVEFKILEGLYINEVLSKHKSFYPDENGDCSDWIEIYNNGTKPVDLGGLYITDILTYPKKIQIPRGFSSKTTVQAKGFLVFRADHMPELGPLHLGLELSSKGEDIALVQKTPDGVVFLDSWSFGALPYDVSYGRYPDGKSEFDVLSEPTPGAPNKHNFTAITGLFINEFMADNLSVYPDENGICCDWIEIYNSTGIPIDLGGLYLTDVLNDPFKFMIPNNHPDKTIIQPYGFIVFRANNEPGNGVLNLGFQLASMGEAIGLYQNIAGEATAIDKLTYTRQRDKISYGRYHDGENTWELMETPTPGSANVLGASADPGGNTGTGTDIILQPGIPGVKTGVFPNPFVENISLRIDLEQSTRMYVSVLDHIGNTIWSPPLNGTFFAKGEHLYTNINAVNSAAEGVYFLRIIVGDQAIVHRFVKLRH